MLEMLVSIWRIVKVRSVVHGISNPEVSLSCAGTVPLLKAPVTPQVSRALYTPNAAWPWIFQSQTRVPILTHWDQERWVPNTNSIKMRRKMNNENLRCDGDEDFVPVYLVVLPSELITVWSAECEDSQEASFTWVHVTGTISNPSMRATLCAPCTDHRVEGSSAFFMGRTSRSTVECLIAFLIWARKPLLTSHNNWGKHSLCSKTKRCVFL